MIVSTIGKNHLGSVYLKQIMGADRGKVHTAVGCKWLRSTIKRYDVYTRVTTGSIAPQVGLAPSG